MNCILAVRSAIKIKFGLRGFAAAHVQRLGQAADIESEGFAYLRQKFPKISKTKMKEGIFVGYQIKQLFEDHDFSTKSNSTELRAWEASENVWRNFINHEKADN
jgi:hypothetical protein